MLRNLLMATLATSLLLLSVGCESRKEEPGTAPPAPTRQEPAPATKSVTATAPGQPSLPKAPETSTATSLPIHVNKGVPFKDALEPKSFELASGALATWRTYASMKPKLLLFASHPLLNPLPEETAEDIKRLVAAAPDQELIRRSSASASDTLLVSPQTVSAAIDARLISELLVVLPTREKPTEVSLEKFAKRATAAGFLTEAEGAGLTLKGSTISGKVRGIPLQVVHPEALPAIAGPFLMHVDLSYFKELYVNEVKTPIYDIIYEFATAIRDAGYKPAAVTLSFSNQEVGIALSSRFVLRDIATLMRAPKYLQGGAPASWTHRAAAMYASVMFNQSKSHELTELAAKDTPDDAAALFELALLRFEQGRTEEGFAVLDRAVALDRGYALAYVDLADRGQAMGQWRKSLELQHKATAAFPDNDELRVRLAGDLIQRGRSPEARPLLAKLLKQPWSSLYHPGMVETLGRMQEAAQVDSILPLPDEPQQPAAQPRRAQGLPPSHMGVPMHRPRPPE